jgi:DNA-directed RNA polymerase beta' subunit
MSLLIDTMTYKGQLMSIDRHGINRGDIGPLAKSSFEESTDMLINASIFAEYDKVNGVSANVMLGQQPPCGTGDSRVLIDEEHMMELLKNMTEAAGAAGADAKGKKEMLNVIPEDDKEEDNDVFTNDDLQIVINQKEVKKSKCYKLPKQKVIIT